MSGDVRMGLEEPDRLAETAGMQRLDGEPI